METIWSAISTFLILMKTFNFFDFLDILVVSVIIYGLIKLLKETRAGQLIKGLLAIGAIYCLSYPINLKMIRHLLDYIFQFGGLVFFVMFQPEIRRALEHIGHSKISNYGNLVSSGESIENIQKKCICAVTTCAAAFQMSKTGALIVFERQTKLGDIIETGTIIDAEPSVTLIGNIFFNKAPLHDGAVIIRDGRIYAAGCILPLTKNENVSTDLGTRHRAAIGMSENSDAILLTVSEETGNISLTTNGVLKQNYTKDSLRKELEKVILSNDKKGNVFKTSFSRFFKRKS